MLTQRTYTDFLLNTPRNCTGTRLAAQLPTVSHDQVHRFLRDNTFSSSQLRDLVQPLSADSPAAFLLVDDSVRDKRYRRFIEVAQRRYSGNVHGVVTGIGLVNLVPGSGERGDFPPLDFRYCAPDQDGRTKNDHFQAMFKQVVQEGNIQARTLLFDSWCASSENLKVIHRAGWTFFTTLESNRLVSLSQETGHQALDARPPPPGAGARAWQYGCNRCRLGSNSSS